MPLHHRVLPDVPFRSLDEYVAVGGGRGLAAARAVDPIDVIGVVTASGLRGRGGAGFPTGTKWSAVAANESSAVPTTVVVNAAEGEPSTFKDRSILRRNPYAVLEGALIAAWAVGADRIIVGLKATFETEHKRLRGVIAELPTEWTREVSIHLFGGPGAYLLGEETALLEAIDGRQPFPRLAPPYRRGVDELTLDVPNAPSAPSRSAANIEMAADQASDQAPPALVDNVETLANVPSIVWEGADWFRAVGTASSPGTIVCTITGAVRTPGVGEVAMGTPLSEAIQLVGGGALDGHRVVAVLPGVSGAIVPADRLDTPLTYEDMTAAGSGLGSASFAVFDERADMVAVAAGASRFLYVESCGQCTPCKGDGREISSRLDALVVNEGDGRTIVEIRDHLDTVADGARCALARQHEAVVRSLLDTYAAAFDAHAERTAPPAERVLIAGLVDIDPEEGALIDADFEQRQPDWSDDTLDSGQAPADRATELDDAATLERTAK